MRMFWALLPVAVTLMLFLSHAHAILRPRDTPSSLMHHLFFLVAMLCIVGIMSAMKRAGRLGDGMWGEFRVYLFHRHLSPGIAFVAYCVTLTSIGLLASAMLVGSNPVRGVSALHLVFLSGPALVWVYFKTDRHRSGNGAAARPESGGWMS
jgi:hypothetical protein